MYMGLHVIEIKKSAELPISHTDSYWLQFFS